MADTTKAPRTASGRDLTHRNLVAMKKRIEDRASQAERRAAKLVAALERRVARLEKAIFG